jgi:carbamoyltransferase
MPIILGLNLNHADSSACLIKDNELVFAIEEEKLNRKKHWAGLPMLAIKECIKYANIKEQDITNISLNTNPLSNLPQKSIYFFKNYLFGSKKREIFLRLRKKLIIKNELSKEFNFSKKIKINYIDHHLSHIASSYYPSNFDHAICISIDGFGDFASLVIAEGKGNKINIKEKIFFPDSLGIFYEMMTQLLGFENFGDEYKLMGLSSYGKPIYKEKILNTFFIKNKFFKLNTKYFAHTEKNYSYKFDGIPSQAKIYKDEIFNIIKKKDIETDKENLASSIQSVYEEFFFKIIKRAQVLIKSDNLCLAGGCSLNSVANGKINKTHGIKKLFVPYAPGDAGGAIGSALVTSYKNKNQKIDNLQSPFLGPNFLDEDIKKFISTIDKSKITVREMNRSDLVEFTAKEISNSKIIGWFQGRIEFGQRALGNRSILADPRNKNIRDIINQKIKRRENYRPFAPSVIENYKNEWFEFQISKNHYMETVIKIKHDKKNIVPSVVHVDGSCRVQVVSEKTNFLFYELIKKFYELTGVPILLNTSFNENEPIVCNIEQAYSCFSRTDMDILVLNNFVFLKN